MMVPRIVPRLSENEYGLDVSSMKEMTFSTRILAGVHKTLASLSCRIMSGFQSIKPSLIGFLDVSEDQQRRGIAVAERVSTLSDITGTGGTKGSRARVIGSFNQFATCLSSEPATGIKIPWTLSSCEVPGMRLCTVSVLTPLPEPPRCLG